MTIDDITRMAKDAGFCGFDGKNKCLREFANLVAAAEREACAKVCENGTFLHDFSPEAKYSRACARAIRARGRYD
jgi:hypothetical protein